MGNSQNSAPSPEITPKPKRKTTVKEKPAEKRIANLTNLEIRVVRRSWTAARQPGKDEPGLSILLEIFHRSPEISQIFAIVQKQEDLYASVVGENSNLIPFADADVNANTSAAGGRPKTPVESHAQRFTRVLDVVVDKLDSLEDVEPVLKILGHRHARLDKTIKFLPAYWDIFAEVLVEKSVHWTKHGLPDQSSALAIEAWCRIMLWMVGKMKQGFDEAQKPIRPDSPTTTRYTERLARKQLLSPRRRRRVDSVDDGVRRQKFSVVSKLGY